MIFIIMILIIIHFSLLCEGAGVDPLFLEDGPEVFCQVAQHIVAGKPAVVVFRWQPASVGRRGLAPLVSCLLNILVILISLSQA